MINKKNLPNTLIINKVIQSMALQNNLNEYIFYETQSEAELIKILEKQIKEEISKRYIVNFTHLLLLGCYRDLKQYNWINKIQFSFHYLKSKERFITLPSIEEKIKKNIIIIDEIENNVSKNVKKQYEENPYPKWIQLPSNVSKLSLKEYLKKKKIYFQANKKNTFNNTDILIAGCGTGQEPISYSLIIDNCDITAIDLSQSSLAYAIRKSKEYQLKNIKFFQCDILNVKNLKTKFDIICCNGVLHHLNDPLEGWSQLGQSLKNNGLMRISLYSKLARSHLEAYQEKFKKRHVLDIENEIRTFRNDILNSSKNEIDNLSILRDFFNLSELRDLIFHYKEHQFTIPKIKEALKELNFKFINVIENSINSIH